MHQIITISKVIFILSVLSILSGCWDRNEVEERAYVIALGLDKSKTTDKLEVSFLIENPEVGSTLAGINTQEPSQQLITVQANDFITAKTTANSIISRDITYDLLQIIIVSEELAKDKDFIRWMYDALKDREVRRETYLAVSKEKTSTFFNNNDPKLETRPHKYYQFMINHGIDTGIIPDSDIHRFFKRTENGDSLFLAMYITTETAKNPPIKNEDDYLAGQVKIKGTVDKTQFLGSAVFKDGIMIGHLDGQETRITNILDDTTQMENLLATFPDPFSDKQRISARVIKEQNNTIKVNLKGKKPKVLIEVPLLVDVLSDPALVDNAKATNMRKSLEKHIENNINKLYKEYINKTQTELKGATFPISLEVRKKFQTIQEYEKYNWAERYSDAEIDVKASIKIKEFGKQMRITPIEEIRD
jgi:spore germination protein KC